MRRPRFAYLVLADAKPPLVMGFKGYRRWWWKKLPSKTEALNQAHHLAALDIHGVIKKCRADKPAKPRVIPESPIKTRGPAADKQKIRNTFA